MRGKVHWFNNQLGYGFLKSEEGKDVFFHYSNIVMEGFKELEENDVVNYELGAGNDGREQAVNVQPILTRKMVEKALKKEKLQLKTVKDALGDRAYMVVDANNVIQVGEHGLSLINIAAFAGFDIEGLE